MGNSPWDLKELDMTEQLILSLSLHPLSEIRCNPPIFFCPLCVCVCVYTIVLKRQLASVQVELELMKQSKKPLASQMALSLDYDLTQVSSQQS